MSDTIFGLIVLTTIAISLAFVLTIAIKLTEARKALSTPLCHKCREPLARVIAAPLNELTMPPGSTHVCSNHPDGPIYYTSKMGTEKPTPSAEI